MSTLAWGCGQYGCGLTGGQDSLRHPKPYPTHHLNVTEPAADQSLQQFTSDSSSSDAQDLRRLDLQRFAPRRPLLVTFCRWVYYDDMHI